MINFWDILGLEPTADRKKIKKRYAKLLKQANPEDDPLAFMRLRAAYERALCYVPGLVQSDESDSSPFSSIETSFDAHGQLEVTKVVEKTLLAVSALYQDYDSRCALSNWFELLNSPEHDDFRVRERLRIRLFEFVLEHNCLRPEVWTLLNEMFGWLETDNELEQLYPGEETEFILEQLDEQS